MQGLNHVCRALFAQYRRAFRLADAEIYADFAK